MARSIIRILSGAALMGLLLTCQRDPQGLQRCHSTISKYYEVRHRPEEFTHSLMDGFDFVEIGRRAGVTPEAAEAEIELPIAFATKLRPSSPLPSITKQYYPRVGGGLICVCATDGSGEFAEFGCVGGKSLPYETAGLLVDLHHLRR